jgi:hypothetical protein
MIGLLESTDIGYLKLRGMELKLKIRKRNRAK